MTDIDLKYNDRKNKINELYLFFEDQLQENEAPCHIVSMVPIFLCVFYHYKAARAITIISNKLTAYRS